MQMMSNLTPATTNIHPTVIIEEGAQIDPTSTIGAYAYIGPHVKIGPNNTIHHHACVEGNTEIGEGNEIFPFAVIGGKTQDKKYKGGNPGLKIGDNNVFREYVTIHLATYGNDFTVVGNNNSILAYSHIAHDCQVGSNLVMSSHSSLGGHVIIHDHVNIGAYVGVHQFCQIGSYAMLGACSKIVQSVLPYMLADGNPAAIRTINKIGLERAGYSSEDIEAVRFVFKTLYKSGLNRSQAIKTLQAQKDNFIPIVKPILAFLEDNQRGLT